MGDVVDDLENYAELIKIEENQTCDGVATTLKVEQTDNDSFMNLEQSPNTGLKDYDYSILQCNEQSVVKDECEPDMCSDNDEMPLVIDEKDSKDFENLQRHINQKQIEPCVVKELVVDKKQLSLNNGGVNVENKLTEENNINAIFQPLFGHMSNYEGQSLSNEQRTRSTSARRLKPRDLGIHRESESEEESDDYDDVPPFAKNAQSSDPLQMSETNGVMRDKEFFLANYVVKNPCHRCYICHKSFSTKASLRIHMKNLHLEEYKCPKCDIVHNNARDMYDHYKSMHPSAPFATNPCDMCHKRYKSRKCLTIHKRLRHVEPITIYSCDTCGKKFDNHSSYRNHIVTDHPPDKTKS